MKTNYGFFNISGFFFLILFQLFTFNTLNAQWNQSGLDGYYIRTLIVSGTNIFAGTSGDGIYRSTNNGTSWVPVNSGLTNLYVFAFTVSGTNLFAGTEGDGVFISTNNGDSWSATGTLSNQYVYALASAGSDIYTGTDGDGVFRTTNNGVSWNPASSGITNLRILNLTFSGTSLFAGTFGTGGIYRTSNNGVNWSAANNGLTNFDVWGIAVSGSNLFAGTSGGVFISTNNGTDWSSSSSGLTDNYIHSFAVSGLNIFAGTDNNGVFRSTNSGANWIAINEGLTKASVWVLAVSGSNLFAGSNGSGVFKRPLSELVDIRNFSPELPEKYRLSQNYPNPFNPVTKINYELQIKNYVSFKIFDIQGNQIKSLVNSNQTAGRYEINFDGSDFPSGIYFYTLKTGNFSETKRMILLK